MKAIKLGILAGMGPRSTSPFLEKVIDLCQDTYGARWDGDFPHMIVYSLPTPFRVDRPYDYTEMEESLRQGVQSLVKAGIDVLAIPCNVAHLHIDVIRSAAKSVKVLNIVDETLNGAVDLQDKIVVLGTRPVVESRLYQDRLAQHGYHARDFMPYQQQVDELIQAYKQEGVSAHVLALWNQLEGYCISQGIKSAIIACTDLAFCSSHSKRSGIEYFDSTIMLAQSLVNNYLRLR